MTRSTHVAAIASNAAFALDLVKHRSFRHFTSDVAVRYAFEHALMIIGQAVSQVPVAIRANYPLAPWAMFASISEDIKTDRSAIDPKLIWGLATTQLLTLQLVAERILADVDKLRCQTDTPLRTPTNLQRRGR